MCISPKSLASSRARIEIQEALQSVVFKSGDTCQPRPRPWPHGLLIRPECGVFVGGETICYVAIALLFVFMGVERFSDLDHKAIEERQRQEALAAGVEYVPTAERLKREEEEADAKAQEETLKQLEARCQKKGLDFAKEKEAYLADLAEKEKKAQEADAAKKAKQKAAEDAKIAKQEAKLAAMSPEQKAAYEEKQAAKAAKAERDAEKLRADYEAEVAKASNK